jgi:hypothetical protein
MAIIPSGVLGSGNNWRSSHVETASVITIQDNLAFAVKG